ncbi:hypothetical protein [Halalkalicoccus salilacus]|uniref:hypothetical protein n=1 Tax=Halalkalicoccus sp. GCM10025704 TaxID=3252662 RepID=UPI00360D2C49
MRSVPTEVASRSRRAGEVVAVNADRASSIERMLIPEIRVNGNEPSVRLAHAHQRRWLA